MLIVAYCRIECHCAVIGPKRNELRQNSGRALHGEDVANDSTDAGGRALKRFNRARVIVALHLKGDRPAVADIDNAGVFFSSAHKNVRVQ